MEVVKADLDKFQFQEINVVDATVTTIAAKKRRQFVDPFVYKENADDEALSSSRLASPTPPTEFNPSQLLGNKRIQDEKGGDAGCLYKVPMVMPTVFFIRASCIAKASSVYPHPEMQQLTKGMKQFFVTTGVGLSYHNDFEVHIYNIQKPSKETVIQDFTYDYFSKVIQQKKLLAKKKVEKNLASLISQLTAGQEQKVFDPKVALEKMRANCAKPSRSFKMPYPITATCYKTSEEERQYVAVGLMDGAIVVLDLALGMEKYFLEKHPAAVSSIAFFEEKVIISGSIDGRVNLCDLDSEN